MDKQADYTLYTFAPETYLKIEGQQFTFLNRVMKEILDQESVYDVDIKTKFYNNKTGKFVKKVTKANSQFISKVFDPEGTMNANLNERLSKTGQDALRVISILNTVHMKNVDEGNGILFEDLAKRYQAPKPEMEVVDAGE